MRSVPASAVGMRWTLAIALLAACTEIPGPLLTEPRFVAILAEPPALIPPGAVTLTARVYDPDFRGATVDWYLALGVNVTQIEAVRGTLEDPTTVSAATDGLAYMGSGTTITVTVPEVPPSQLPVEDIFDVLPATVLAVAHIGAIEIKAVKQVRLVLPVLVERVLARQLGRQPTDSEIAEALALRLNHNPLLRGFQFSLVPSVGDYSLEAALDVKERKALTAHEISAPTGVRPNGALRVTPDLEDVDADPDKKAGEPGYNKLEADVLAEFGTFFPLSLTSFDWFPGEIEQRSVFLPPKINGARPRLSTVHVTVFDRQGGTANRAFEVDVGADPLPEHRGRAGSVLAAEGARLLWLRFADAEAMNRFTGYSGTVAVTAVARYEPVPPHGVVVDAQTIAGPATYSTDWLDRLSADPNLAPSLSESIVNLTVRAVRVWKP